jgi:FtsP/CotA-like multicopper oxidase with cupredoxin domain
MLEVNGKPVSVYGIRQPDGTDGITTLAGDRFRVHVENQIGKPSLVHWHGLAPPWQQDGVPGVSGPPIQVGGSADYDFPLRYGGTFYMHSHEGLQEQSLMVAPLIIHDARDRTGVQEVVVMLGDFSFAPPEQIFENLKRRNAMPKMAGMTGMAQGGAGAARDLNDVKYDAFLANYRTLADPEVVKVEWRKDAAADHQRLLDDQFSYRTRPIAGRTDRRRRLPRRAADRPALPDRRCAAARHPPCAAASARGLPIPALVEGERRQTGIVLAAGRADIARVPETTDRPSPALTLDFEHRLRAAAPLRPRKPDRVHTLNLTGEMVGYIWSINNIVWNKDVPPLPIAAGERVELVMINRTGMSHPMHLHGHQFQVVEIDGKRFPGAVRDTILVPPGRRVVVVFDANNPGLWAFHCHLLYHLKAGMFTTLRYV